MASQPAEVEARDFTSDTMTKSANFVRKLLEGTDVSCEISLPSGEILRFGSTPPKSRVMLHSNRALNRIFDEFAIAQAYVNGEIDIEGDVMSLLDLRSRISDRVRILPFLKFWFALLLQSPTWVNKKSIDDHYSFGDDFYLTFIDTKYRFYSHGIFRSEDETLEQASEHKLETMYEALQLKPGMRLLDIGGGWGGVTQYCGSRGIHVTTLTLAKDSYNYIHNLLQREKYEGEVFFQDFLEHNPAQPYDAIVIYGVIEHIPYYRRFFQKSWDCLRPNGLMYMDASASKEKYDMSAFTRRYIWHGTHTFLCLQDVVQELLYNGFELVRVRRESRDYELTMYNWAQRFDANREMIINRWGEQIYRAFRLYLWGGCHAFRQDILQAYHLVIRRGGDPGPRPSLARRIRNLIRELA